MMDIERSRELSGLRAKLAAREGRPGYADNVEAIKARIAELEVAAQEDDDDHAG